MLALVGTFLLPTQHTINLHVSSSLTPCHHWSSAGDNMLVSFWCFHTHDSFNAYCLCDLPSLWCFFLSSFHSLNDQFYRFCVLSKELSAVEDWRYTFNKFVRQLSLEKENVTCLWLWGMVSKIYWSTCFSGRVGEGSWESESLELKRETKQNFMKQLLD